jgi:Xaa-Pro aminopeptidase
MKRRRKKIRELMELRGIDCLIITGHTGTFGCEAANIYYAAGFLEVFSGTYIVYPYAEDPVFIAGGPVWAVGVEKEDMIPQEPVTFRPGTRVRDYATSIVNKIKQLGLEKGTLGIVSMRVMPADVYTALVRGLPYANVVPAGDLLLQCRLIKSREELDCIRKSGECADKGLEAIVEAAQPGVTEEELVAHCDMAMIQAGSPRGNFILLRSGPWSEMQGPIGMGAQRKLRKGDLILNEITSCYNGYYTQLCVPISLGGDVPNDFIELLEINRAMYETALDGLRPGNMISSIEEKVAEVAASYGKNFRRAWATQTVELAEAFFKLNIEVKAGMAFVNHPWTELEPGKGYMGHTIGNTCIVTEGEAELVHTSDLNLKVV